jgi:hypothetical protein
MPAKQVYSVNFDIEDVIGPELTSEEEKSDNQESKESEESEESEESQESEESEESEKVEVEVEGEESEELIRSICVINEDSYSYYEKIKGYKIITSRGQIIKVTLEMRSLCCEKFDIMMVNKKGEIYELNKFKDAILFSVGFGTKLMCNSLLVGISSEHFKEMSDYQKVFVNIKTNKGDFQIFAYNDHNGYYPHDITFEWDGFNETQKI